MGKIILGLKRLRDNNFLTAILATGTVVFMLGLFYFHDLATAIGVAFITAASVGIYMMVATDRIATNLHMRLDDMTAILNVIAESQKEILASQKGILASQKEIIASQKEMTASMGRMELLLQSIDRKLG